MADRPITFEDGAAYERFMGRWSRLAGEVFLDWLAPPPGLHWADVGCGNGAFTELLFTRAGAAHVEALDPSSGQLDYARTRLAGRSVALQQGIASALPLQDGSVDASAMALVIFFVPTPEDGIAEMLRVTRPGGSIAAYAWDIPGGGFPTEMLSQALRRFGIEPQRPPRADISTIAALDHLWRAAGLQGVRTRTIEVERDFADFDDWWSSIRGASSLAAALGRLSADETARLQDALRDTLNPGPDGRIRARARANAVAGTKPG